MVFFDIQLLSSVIHSNIMIEGMTQMMLQVGGGGQERGGEDGGERTCSPIARRVTQMMLQVGGETQC